MDTNKIKNMMAVMSNGNHQGLISSVQNGLKANVLHNAAPSGFESDITTLTQIKTKVIDQKFYDSTQLNPADFVPIKVGEGAFTEESLYYKNFSISGGFASGIIGQGTSSRKGKSEALFDKVRLSNFFWAKELEYSLIEVQQASQNLGSAINLIVQKEKAQRTNWNLGIQETAFLGQDEITGIDGALTLNNQGVNINTTDLVKPISAMTVSEINVFVATLIKLYRANNSNTAWPNTFLIPESDHLGLATFVSELTPTYTKADYLETAFRKQTGNSIWCGRFNKLSKYAPMG